MKKRQINFFEEFFTTQDLIERCKKIPPNSTIYVAAQSLNHFLSLQKIVRKEEPRVELGFWPIMPKSYWISPFSFSLELTTLYESLLNYNGGGKIKVLLDLELPLITPKLFITNIFSFKKNKKIIEKLFDLSKIKNIQLFSAEHPMPLPIIRWMATIIGIHYSHKKFKYTTIVMLFNTPVGRITKKLFSSNIISQIKNNPDYEIALGLIAPGVFGESNLLSYEALKKDLYKLNQAKTSIVTFYSLTGFTGKYQKIIMSFYNGKI